MNGLAQKLSSRKFWVAVAAFLGSIGGSIAGFTFGNEIVSGIGIVCTMLSAAIYVAAEAYVDAAGASSKVTTVSATTTSKEVVAALSNTTIPDKTE